MLESTKQKNNTREKALILLMLFIFVGSLYCMFFDNSIFGLITLSNSKNTQPIVGRIESHTKDIRHKDSNSLSWEEARTGDRIRVGDRIFTGKESSMSLNLEKGGSLELGENTMITFSNADGQSLANLSFGKVKVNVDGNVKVAINGQVQNLHGKKSQIEISVDSKKRTQFKVLKGQADVPTAKIEEPLAREVATERPAAKAEEIVVNPKVLPKLVLANVSYVDRLYDFYVSNDKTLVRRPERRTQVQARAHLEWGIEGLANQISGEISNSANFDSSVQKFSSLTDHYDTEIGTLGENFWHVRIANLSWSPTLKYSVVARPLNVMPPVFHAATTEIYLLDDSAAIRADIEANSVLTGFVIETSNSPFFEAEKTQIKYSNKKKIAFKVGEPQEIYMRMRGVNAATEITEYSPVMKLRVQRAPMPVAPQLAEKEYHIYPDQTLDLEWNKAENAANYDVELKDSNNQVVETKRLSENSHQLKNLKVGKYDVKITSVDRFGRKSNESKARVAVEPRIQPPVAKHITPPPPARKISSAESTLSVKQDIPPTQSNLNDKFSSSKIELKGGGEIGVSSQGLANSDSNPDYVTMGVKVTHWVDNSGFEGQLSSKVAGVSSASAETSPLQAEARYMYRWRVPWNLFSNIDATQVSLIGGYEFYRNSASGNFSPGYDILKTGFGLTFPVARRWDSGGEVLYGKGFDASTQYEISGNANYYIRSDWSIGVGYRVHLFEAGSASSAPNTGLPYREGFGEAFSVIRKHY